MNALDQQLLDVAFRALRPRRETRQERMLSYGIPPHMLDGLERYLVQRIKPGSFLQAVLRGDLVMAAQLADPANADRLQSYVDYLTAECPEECWGSPEAMRHWLAGPDYPCYACGRESTHEIRHRGDWLDACDACDVRGER